MQKVRFSVGKVVGRLRARPSPRIDTARKTPVGIRSWRATTARALESVGMYRGSPGTSQLPSSCGQPSPSVYAAPRLLSATSCQRPKSFPCSWRRGHHSTNIATGPLKGGGQSSDDFERLQHRYTLTIGIDQFPEITANSEARTLREALLRHAAASPESFAIVSSTYQPFSFGELAAQLDYFGTTLRAAGLGYGSRVAIALSDAPQAALAIISVSCAAVAVPLDPNLTRVEMETRLKLLGADAIIVLAGDDSPLRDDAERQGILVIEAVPVTEGGLSLSLVGPKKAVAAPPSTPGPREPAFILQSSGTTAEPKLIPYSHANMLAAAARVKGWFNLHENDRCLSVTPVYYCHGLTLTVFAPLLSGGSVAFPASSSRPDLKEWLIYLKPSWYSAGPTMHRAILEKARSHEDKPISHELRFVLSGGAPLSPEIQLELQSTLGVAVLDHYGLTEAAQISTNLPPPGPAKMGTCGIPDPDTVMIVGADGAPLRPGDTGEILVGGPSVIERYLNAPDLTTACFVDGWFRTGDIGSIDEEGFLIVRGRLKEIINRGGEKISPMEIEVALLRHPDVAEAAAFAVPHPRLGDDVAAAVVLHPHASAMPDELRQFLGTQIAWFKVPRRITVLQELPKGKTGKIQRRRISENTQ